MEEMENTFVHLKNEAPEFLRSLKMGIHEQDQDLIILATQHFMHVCTVLKQQELFIDLQKANILLQLNNHFEAKKALLSLLPELEELVNQISEFQLEPIFDEIKR